jgi:DNA polymerase
VSDPRLENIANDLRTWLLQQQATGSERVHVDWSRVGQIQGRNREALANAKPASSRASSTQAEELQSLCEEVAGCVKCKLHSTRTQTVFGTGNPDADLVFVGEAPGRDEDLKGEPFVGAAGQLLTKILGAIELSRDEVYICNVLKCRPPQNRDPERDEVQSCEPHLKRQLDILRPKLICCLGRHAAHTLLGTTATLKSLRAHIHDYYGIPTVVTYHPAALLRNPQWKRPTWEDVQKLRAMYNRLRD